MAELSKILHVDDDEDILEITRMALQMVDDFELDQFSSCPPALDAIADVKPDLLLLDVMMPGMTGPEMWDAVKAMPTLDGLPVIFMTAKAEERLAQDLRGRGALEVVTKPFDPMTLGARIREAWERQ